MQRVSSDAASLVSLAIEELITNCTKYGCDDSNDHTVDIVHSVDDGALSPPDLSLAMENRLIGGLGIHLLRDANVQEPTDPALKPNCRLKTHGKAPRLLIVW